MAEFWTVQTLRGQNLAKETEVGDGGETWRAAVSQERVWGHLVESLPSVQEALGVTPGTT